MPVSLRHALQSPPADTATISRAGAADQVGAGEGPAPDSDRGLPRADVVAANLSQVHMVRCDCHQREVNAELAAFTRKLREHGQCLYDERCDTAGWAHACSRIISWGGHDGFPLGVQGWWLRVEQDVDGLLAARSSGAGLPGDAAGRLDRLETAVGRLQTVLEAAARQLEASAVSSQVGAVAKPTVVNAQHEAICTTTFQVGQG